MVCHTIQSCGSKRDEDGLSHDANVRQQRDEDGLPHDAIVRQQKRDAIVRQQKAAAKEDTEKTKTNKPAMAD